MDQNHLKIAQPFLPPLGEFLPLLEDIWMSKNLTNFGKYHRMFESELASYLDVEHLSLVSSATLGLNVALKLLNISGEVITTPYSFVATSNVLAWQKLKLYLLILIHYHLILIHRKLKKL